MSIYEILNKFTTGETTIDEANEELKEAGSTVYIRANGKMGNALLDIGVGSMEFVIVEDNKLVNAAGVPHQDQVYYKGAWHTLADDGVTLEV